MNATFALILFLATATVSSAQVISFNVSLDGPQAGTTSLGTGTGTATLNTSTLEFILNGTFSGLGTAATAAHVHGPATTSQSAGVLQGITVSSATSGNFSFSGIVSSEASTVLQSDMAYVNIHTTGFGGGEIRGQLTVVPEPAAAAVAMGLVLAGAAAWSRNCRKA